MRIERIAALLAKAERTDNEAEAEAYLMKAQALATAASIDLAVARTRMAKSRPEPTMRTVTIGERGKRANPHLVALFIAIADPNDAHVDVAHDSTFVIAYGMPSDLEVVEAVFASVSVQMVQAGQIWVRGGAWRGETYTAVRRGRGGWVRRPHTAQTAKVAFYRAYAERIGERLREARDETVRESRAPGTELVLRDKAAEVREFHRASSTARGTWGGYSGGVRGDRGSSSGAGRAAASRARIGESAQLPGGREALPEGG